jgi:hypothetical protein
MSTPDFTRGVEAAIHHACPHCDGVVVARLDDLPRKCRAHEPPTPAPAAVGPEPDLSYLSEGPAKWLVVIIRESVPEVTPFESEGDARRFFASGAEQWSDAWLARTVLGPRDTWATPASATAAVGEVSEADVERLDRVYREALLAHSRMGDPLMSECNKAGIRAVVAAVRAERGPDLAALREASSALVYAIEKVCDFDEDTRVGRAITAVEQALVSGTTPAEPVPACPHGEADPEDCDDCNPCPPPSMACDKCGAAPGQRCPRIKDEVPQEPAEAGRCPLGGLPCVCDQHRFCLSPNCKGRKTTDEEGGRHG